MISWKLCSQYRCPHQENLPLRSQRLHLQHGLVIPKEELWKPVEQTLLPWASNTYCDPYDIHAIWISIFWLGGGFNWFHYFKFIPFFLFTIYSATRELFVFVAMNTTSIWILSVTRWELLEVEIIWIQCLCGSTSRHGLELWVTSGFV